MRGRHEKKYTSSPLEMRTGMKNEHWQFNHKSTERQLNRLTS